MSSKVISEAITKVGLQFDLDTSSILDPASHAVRKVRTNRQPQDTVIGCLQRAAADRAEAAISPTLNAKAKMEISAASWSARAALLQRGDDVFAARV